MSLQRSVSYRPGVAETNIVCGAMTSYSSKRRGTVVERRRQAKTVVDKGFLAGAVAPVHASELRDGSVAFVNEEQRIVRQIVEQARRRLPFAAP